MKRFIVFMMGLSIAISTALQSSDSSWKARAKDLGDWLYYKPEAYERRKQEAAAQRLSAPQVEKPVASAPAYPKSMQKFYEQRTPEAKQALVEARKARQQKFANKGRVAQTSQPRRVRTTAAPVAAPAQTQALAAQSSEVLFSRTPRSVDEANALSGARTLPEINYRKQRNEAFDEFLPVEPQAVEPQERLPRRSSGTVEALEAAYGPQIAPAASLTRDRDAYNLIEVPEEPTRRPRSAAEIQALEDAYSGISYDLAPAETKKQKMRALDKLAPSGLLDRAWYGTETRRKASAWLDTPYKQYRFQGAQAEQPYYTPSYTLTGAGKRVMSVPYGIMAYGRDVYDKYLSRDPRMRDYSRAYGAITPKPRTKEEKFAGYDVAYAEDRPAPKAVNSAWELEEAYNVPYTQRFTSRLPNRPSMPNLDIKRRASDTASYLGSYIPSGESIKQARETLWSKVPSAPDLGVQRRLSGVYQSLPSWESVQQAPGKAVSYVGSYLPSKESVQEFKNQAYDASTNPELANEPSWYEQAKNWWNSRKTPAQGAQPVQQNIQ